MINIVCCNPPSQPTHIGILIAPVGNAFIKITRDGDGKDERESICGVRYAELESKDDSPMFIIEENDEAKYDAIAGSQKLKEA